MAKTDIRLIFSCPRKYRVFEDRRVVTDRGEKYEGMPDRVLETQAPPKMKDDTYRIHHAAQREAEAMEKLRTDCSQIRFVQYGETTVECP